MNDFEKRLLRCEEQLTWIQKHLIEQDKIMNLRFREIDSVKTLVADLKKQNSNSSEIVPPATEKPPHY